MVIQQSFHILIQEIDTVSQLKSKISRDINNPRAITVLSIQDLQSDL